MSSLCRFFVGLFALIGAFFVILFLCTLIINRTIQFPTFQVESASLNQLTGNGRKLGTEKMSAAWNITVSLSNPKQYLSVSYQDTLDAEIFYMDEYGGIITLNTSTIQPFNGSMIEMKLKVDSCEPHVTNNIYRSRREHGRVEFGLKLFTSIQFKKDIFESNWITLKVVCYPLSFVISQNVYNITTSAGILLQGVTCTRSWIVCSVLNIYELLFTHYIVYFKILVHIMCVRVLVTLENNLM